MAEYIERERLLKKFCSHCYGEDTCDTDCMDIRIIKSIPSADVQPVKHGKWIQLTQNVEPTALKCSLCGEISCCHGMYCPDCGARMDGKI